MLGVADADAVALAVRDADAPWVPLMLPVLLCVSVGEAVSIWLRDGVPDIEAVPLAEGVTVTLRVSVCDAVPVVVAVADVVSVLLCVWLGLADDVEVPLGVGPHTVFAAVRAAPG